VEYLRSENLPLPGPKPRLITGQDLKDAVRIVSFGCDIDARVLPTVPVLHWDDVPSVSQDILTATQDIRARVEHLVTDLATTSPANRQ
jgi:hypothetical protein